jgi:serine O-acetyltransferase
MRFESRLSLKRCLAKDAKNYCSQQSFRRIKYNVLSNPISDQKYIWKYIKCLRFLEYHYERKTNFHNLMRLYYLFNLRKLSYKTGFQIPPFTCGDGLTIWHWGTIIINENAKIGKNVVLNPGIIIGHKLPNTPCPIIGDDVFIGSGVKIIGDVKIGNNVVIAPNSVVVKDIQDNCIVGGVPSKIL